MQRSLWIYLDIGDHNDFMCVGCATCWCLCSLVQHITELICQNTKMQATKFVQLFVHLKFPLNGLWTMNRTSTWISVTGCYSFISFLSMMRKSDLLEKSNKSQQQPPRGALYCKVKTRQWYREISTIIWASNWWQWEGKTSSRTRLSEGTPSAVTGRWRRDKRSKYCTTWKYTQLKVQHRTAKNWGKVRPSAFMSLLMKHRCKEPNYQVKCFDKIENDICAATVAEKTRLRKIS